MTTLTNSLVFSILAFLLGVFGLVLVFSDLGSRESWTLRILVAALFFTLCGLGIGFCNPGGWIISGLTGWGGIFMGSLIVFAALRKYGRFAFNAQEPPYISAGLVMLFMPVGLALAGGYIGKLLKQKSSVTKPLKS